MPTIFLIDTDGTAQVSSMGFNKEDLETIGSELAQRKKIPATALFNSGESVPANKPG